MATSIGKSLHKRNLVECDLCLGSGSVNGSFKSYCQLTDKSYMKIYNIDCSSVSGAQ